MTRHKKNGTAKQDAQEEWWCQGKRKGRGVGKVRDEMSKTEQRCKTRKFLFFSVKNFLMWIN